MMNHITDYDLWPDRREAARDEAESRVNRILFIRYECLDPWCEYAEAPHSHGTGVRSNDAPF
jgi:hypothetical protein